jgi:hypothetical protein
LVTNKLGLDLLYVVAILDCINDGRVGGGAANSLLFKGLDEARFVVARWWLRELLQRVEFFEAQRLAVVQLGQSALLVLFFFNLCLSQIFGTIDLLCSQLFFRGFVFCCLTGALLFLFKLEMSFKFEHAAGHAEVIRELRLRDDVDRCLIEDRGRHLAGDEPLPDELVEPVLFVAEILPDRLRGELYVRRPDGFVGVLRLDLLFARIFVGSCRQILRPQLSDELTSVRNRIGADTGRIGTHVGDETDCSFGTDLNALI